MPLDVGAVKLVDDDVPMPTDQLREHLGIGAPGGLQLVHELAGRQLIGAADESFGSQLAVPTELFARNSGRSLRAIVILHKGVSFGGGGKTKHERMSPTNTDGLVNLGPDRKKPLLCEVSLPRRRGGSAWGHASPRGCRRNRSANSGAAPAVPSRSNSSESVLPIHAWRGRESSGRATWVATSPAKLSRS